MKILQVGKIWQVTSPGDNVVHSMKGTSGDKFEFKAPRSGMYKFCFHNPYSTPETVSFYIHVGYIPNEHNLAKVEHLDPINVKIAELREALESVTAEQKYLKAGGARHRHRSNESGVGFEELWMNGTMGMRPFCSDSQKERMDHLLEMSKWQKKWYHGGESKFQNPCVMNRRSFGDGEGLFSQGVMEMMMLINHGLGLSRPCCIMKRAFDQGTFQDVQLIFDGTIDHIVEFMVDQFGNYLMQKLLNFCNNEQRMQILLRVIREPGS
nr:transmembrane emp24 domain-containing protein p24beta3-like [Ipomoea trifida]